MGKALSAFGIGSFRVRGAPIPISVPTWTAATKRRLSRSAARRQCSKGSSSPSSAFSTKNTFSNLEESDACLRVVRKELKLLYYTGSSIVHTGGLIAEGNSPRSTGNYLDSFAYYLTKNYGPAACRAGTGLIISRLSPPRRGPQGETGPAIRVLRVLYAHA